MINTIALKIAISAGIVALGAYFALWRLNERERISN